VLKDLIVKRQTLRFGHGFKVVMGIAGFKPRRWSSVPVIRREDRRIDTEAAISGCSWFPARASPSSGVAAIR
jgi:hypothetical protein